MRKKLMLLSMAVVAMIALASVATFALFTATTGTASEKLTAGTVSIAVDNAGTWSINVGQIAPGDTVTKTVTIKNTGSLPFDYATQMERTGSLFSGATPLVVNLTNGTGHIAPGATADVTANATLGLDAGNSYQGVTGNLVLTFLAYQSNNLTTVASTATKTGFSAPWDIYKFYDNVTGEQIQLVQPNMISFTEIWPNGVIRSYPATPGDPQFYFNTAPTRPHGTYHYRVVMNNGKVYEPTIDY